jgi:hypothetical protein
MVVESYAEILRGAFGMRNVQASRHINFGALFVPCLWSVPRLLDVHSNALMKHRTGRHASAMTPVGTVGEVNNAREFSN